MWSIQNITRIALMQVGVVIANILASGVYHKWKSISDPMPAYPDWWYQHGIWGFGLPICWVVLSVYLYNQDEIDESFKLLIFWLGVFAVIALAVLAINYLIIGVMPDVHLVNLGDH